MFLFTIPSFCQISIGVKGGVTLSKLKFKSDLQGYDFKNLVGFNAGIFADYNFTKEYSIVLEIVYNQRGTKYGTGDKYLTGGYFEPAHEFIQTLNYLDLPLLFKYTIPLDWKIKPIVMIGPQYSFLLNAKIEYSDIVSNRKNDNSSDFKNNDFGLIFGLGAKYDIKPGSILFSARYYKGLNNLNADSGSDIKAYGFQINAGYTIPL